MRTKDWQGLEEVHTLELDIEFCPSTDLIYREDIQSWELRMIDPSESKTGVTQAELS